jgi:aryl-alcohol dehydrogenase-like predicted oxidoreductase
MSPQSVALPDGTVTSALGFGCSALVGGRTAKESLRLLDAAYDAGIRHFDVARVYGTGDAEAVLGRFAGRHRDEISIATKFGIDPLPRTAPINALKHLVRPAMRRSRRLLGFVRRHASVTVSRREFTPEGARRSLETSLRELATPYIDVLLLHDCTAEQWAHPQLQETLADLREQGLIRSFGAASSHAEVTAITRAPGPRPPVAQFESDAVNGHARGFADAANGTVAITYGALREALPAITRHLARDPAQASAWTRDVGADVRVPRQLAALLLCAALHENPHGIVLFSSGSEERIRANARIASEPPFAPEQVQALIARAQRVPAW